MPPSLNGLRALATALPPSERVMAGEVADVVSALVAILTHGEEVVKAAEDGYNGVADFLHGKAVSQAEEAGTPVPERGQVAPTAAPVTPGPSGIGPAIDYNALADAIVAAQERKNLPPDATAPAPTPAPSESGAGTVTNAPMAPAPVTEGTPEADGPTGNDPAARGTIQP